MNFLNNLKVGRRMGLSFGLLTLLIFFVGGLGYFSFIKMDTSVNEIVDVRLPSLDSVLVIEYQFEKVVSSQRSLLNPRASHEMRQNAYDSIAQARAVYQNAMDNYIPLPQSEEEAREWSAFWELYTDWRELNTDCFKKLKELDDTGILNPDEILGYLQMFRADHFGLMNEVADFLLTGEDFEGGLDASLCNFGRWLDALEFESAEFQKLVTTSSVIEPHNKFHENIALIRKLVSEGKKDEALLLFHSGMQASAEKVFEGLDQILDLVFYVQDMHNELTQTMIDKIFPLQERAMQHLDKVVSINRELILKDGSDLQALSSRNKLLIIVSLFVAIAIAIFFGVIISLSIVNPLNHSGRLFDAISSGDMSSSVPEELLNRRDELGHMGAQMATMMNSLKDVFTRLNLGANTLSNSSVELSHVSEETAEGARDSSQRSETVAAAVEEMNASAKSIAEEMEHSAVNLSSVASAMEEMTSTIAEIASNTAKASNDTEVSVSRAENFMGLMQNLGSAAIEIGKVTETINGISEQTNLLALNATIEAARAGEAGRGFAVVAGEIKELAGQTARATDDIREKIDGIQAASERATMDIDGIVNGIQGVNSIVSAIAAAIEEQSSAIREVASNIASASSMVEGANEKSFEMTRVSGDISRDMLSVSSAAARVEEASQKVESTAVELSALSEEIKSIMSQFKL